MRSSRILFSYSSVRARNIGIRSSMLEILFSSRLKACRRVSPNREAPRKRSPSADSMKRTMFSALPLLEVVVDEGLSHGRGHVAKPGTGCCRGN